MSASISFTRLFTYAAEDTKTRLPLSQLHKGCGHLHGDLTIRVAGKPLPSLGFSGSDDVCLNTWTQELQAVREALSGEQDAVYVFDEGEQGQPAYEFRREADLLFVSVIDSSLSGAHGDPSYQQVSCLWADFLDSALSYRSLLKATLESEAPDIAAKWWAEHACGAA